MSAGCQILAMSTFEKPDNPGFVDTNEIGDSPSNTHLFIWNVWKNKEAIRSKCGVNVHQKRSYLKEAGSDHIVRQNQLNSRQIKCN